MKAKYLFLWLLAILLMFVLENSTNINFTYADGDNDSVQTIKIPVESESVEANPIVWYHQLDDGGFRVENDVSGVKYPANAGTDMNPYPEVTKIRNLLDMDNYPANSYEDVTRTKYPHNIISNKRIKKGGLNPLINVVDIYSQDNKTINVTHVTGGDPSNCERFGTRYK